MATWRVVTWRSELHRVLCYSSVSYFSSYNDAIEHYLSSDLPHSFKFGNGHCRPETAHRKLIYDAYMAHRKLG